MRGRKACLMSTLHSTFSALPRWGSQSNQTTSLVPGGGRRYCPRGPGLAGTDGPEEPGHGSPKRSLGT